MRRNHHSHSQLQSDEENQQASSTSQILERVQSDRVTVTKPEEDRRRRTIIVEKRGGSFGFTLQSYGIHYKREKEIEMITYVDHVDYDGPAYRAGMREGDVILSINGDDMEKADHKTLVGYIKKCDARMRMVVLFEDCVRKVELHMRYIQLQRLLQAKMEELDRICARERQLLEGKWKTHSLPSRKKASQASSAAAPAQAAYSPCRPTVSTEDVARVAQQQRPQPLVFAYQYLDAQYRYMLQPSPSSSGEYLLTFEPPRHNKDQQNFPPKSERRQSRGNQTGMMGSLERPKKPPTAPHQGYACAGQLCSPCLRSAASSSNGDNTSLEAYDLASPCCDPRCVPSSRRRSRSHKDHRRTRRDSKTEEAAVAAEERPNKPRPRPHSQASSAATQTSYSVPKRYFHVGSGPVSQCSLHSCTSSEMSNAATTAVAADSSANSYTTSLSTDTLYWDGSCDTTASRQHSVKSNKHDRQRYSQQPETIYVQYSQVKPKSWDNLTTKAFGGYGFGYGYVDMSSKGTQKGGRTHNKSQSTQYVRVDKTSSTNTMSGHPNCTPHIHRRYIQPTKSTESLLSVPKYSSEALSDSSLSCECLEAASPGVEASHAGFFQGQRPSAMSPTNPSFGYYSARRPSRVEGPKNAVTTSSEATRL